MKRSLISLALLSIFIAPPTTSPAAIIPQGDVFPNPYTWDASTFALIGGVSVGELTVNLGSDLLADVAILGASSTGTGVVTVDGPGSSWAISHELIIGQSGIGRLNISNAGMVTNIYSVLGEASGSIGMASVDGPGSAWFTYGPLVIGNAGQGSLSITNGGYVTNGSGSIGEYSGSTGTVTVDGAGSTWNNNSSLFVGNIGSGTLGISNNGSVHDSSCFLASSSGSTGVVTIDGAGSTWTNSSNLYVGYSGAGSVTQNNGTVSVAGSFYLGYYSHSSGTYNLNGGTLTVANISTGPSEPDTTRLFNFNGGTLQVNGSFIYPAEITSTVKTAGAKINTNGYTLTINSALLHDDALGSAIDGGLMKSGTGILTLAGLNTYTGDTRINAGTLKWGNANAVQNSTLDLNAADAGSVDFNGLNPVLGGLKGSRNLDLGENWISIGKNNQSTTYSGQLFNGGFDKIGTGTLTLTADQSSTLFYWTVSQGTLVVDGQLLSFMDGVVTVMNGATLAGHGSILGGAVLDNGAHLAPDHTNLGSIYIDSCGLLNGVQLDYDFGVPGTSDLAISDYLYLESGIVLNANNLGGFAEGTYNLFQCGVVDGFVPGPSGEGTFTVADSPLTGKSYSFDYAGDYIRLIVSSLSLDHVWTGGGNNDNWTTAANWGGTVPQANDPLIFSGTTRLNNTNDFAAGAAFSGMTFNAGAGAFTLSGNSITLTGDIVNNSSQTQTINLPLLLSDGSRTVNTAAGNVVLGGVISESGGSCGLIKTGSALLTLGSANTYTGDTRIAAGTLRLGNVNALQHSTLDLNATDAGAVDFNGLNAVLGGLKGSRDLVLGSNTLTIGGNGQSTTYSGQISGSGGLVKTGAGVLSLTGSGHNLYTGDTRVEQGTLDLNVDSSTFSSFPNITVFSGAKLTGIFFSPARNLNIASGGFLSPGKADTHDATWMPVGSITLQTGSILDFDFGDPQQDTNDSLWGVNSMALPSHGLLLNLFNASGTGGLVNGTYYIAGSNIIDGFVGGYSGQGTFTVNSSPLANRRYYFEEVNNEIIMTILNGQMAWTGGGTDNYWTTAANWGGAVPVANDPLIFDGATRLNNTNDFAAGASFSGMTFNAGAGAFNLSGNSITLTGDIVNNSPQTQTIDLPLLLSGGSRTVNTAAGNVVLGGVISESGGSCGLIKTGSALLTLGSANTYTGDTRIAAGTLRLGNVNALQYSTLDLNAADAGAIDSNGLNAVLGGLKGAKNLALGDSMLSVGGNNQSTVYAGQISGNGGFVKTGSGVLTLSGTNLYTGATFLNAGVLEVTLLANAGSGSSLGAPSSASPEYFVLAGGTLYYSGATDASTNRGFTLDGNSAIEVAAGRTVTCSGQVVGDSESDFQKLGSGKLILNKPATSSATLAKVFTVTGSMEISGGVTYHVVDWTMIGENSTGTLDIAGSAVVNSPLIVAGHQGGNGTLNFNSTAPMTVNLLFAANSGTLGAATQGVINIAGSSRINAESVYLGCWGLTDGTLNMSDASNVTSSGDIVLGYFGGNGYLVMNSGTSISSSQNAFLGWGGNGTATLTNASMHAANFFIACGHSESPTGSVGLLTVNGNSNVTADGDFAMGLYFNNGTDNGSGSKGTTILNDTSTVTVGGEIWVGDQWFSPDLLDSTPYQPEGYLILNDHSIVTSNHSSNRWGVLVGRWGGKGLLEIHDNAQLIVHSGINVGDSWGWNATGLLTGDGTVTVDGTAQVVQDTIGNICLGAEGGAGTWNQNGGATTTTANFWLAEWNSWGDAEVLPGTGTLNLNGGTLSVPRICFASNAGPAISTGTVNFNGGTLKAASASSDFISNLPDGGNGSVVCNLTLNVLAGGARIDTNGYSVTVANVLRHDAALGNTFDGGLLKNGAGTLTLAAANTYTGDTRVAAGTMRLGHANALQNSTLDLNGADAGTVDFNGLDAVLGGLKGARNLDLGGIQITCGNNNRSTTYSGQLANGSLVKTGTGNLTLSANQTSPLFGGFVNQGTLTIDGQSFFMTGVMVMNGATLAGHGSILGGAGLYQGAHLSPDLTNLGSIHIDFGYFADGAVLDYDFAAPETSDLTVCDDLFFESGVVLNATNVGGFAVGTYNLFESESVDGFVPGRSGAGTFTIANPPLANMVYSFVQSGDYIQLIVSSPSQGFVWTGGGADNNLTTPGNWAEFAPGDGDPIVFGGTTRLSPNNNYPAGTQFNGIAFVADAGAFTLGGSLINLGGDVVNQSAQIQKINCPLTLVGSDHVIDTGTSGVTLGGAIGESGGSFSLIKRGDGVLTLSGSNTFTGTIHVEQGTLSGNTSSLRVPIENVGSVIFDQAADGVYASALSGSGNLRKKGVAKLLLNGPLGLSGKITVEAGTLELGENVGASLDCNIDDYTTLLINRASTLTLNGYLRGAGGLTVQGGGELVLTQLNSLNGAIDVHNGALSISGGITLAKSVNLAPLIGEAGALRVQGAHNALEIGSLAVGAAGNGSVSITDGANVEINVNQNWITLGQANGGRGTITVNGQGSSLGGGLDVHNRPARPQLLIGGKLSGTSSGVGTVIIQNGASADAKSIVLGGSPQSHGNLVRVEGTGSLLTFDELCIGYSSNPGGSGQLQIADGGRAACTWRVRVGCGEASDGDLSVNGTAAMLGGGVDSTGTFKLPGLWIGGDSTSASGTGRVFVENGGYAELAFIMLGQGTNSRNNLLQISGAGSTVTSADVVSVGYPGGGGTVLVQQSGALTVAQQIKIGAKAGSTGELRIESGGIVESHKGTSSTESSGILGYEAGASGTALIHGNGSQWIQDGVLNVGYAGQGQMTVDNGGLVHSALGVVARQTGSTGSVTISDPGSQWQIDGDLHVGGEPFGAVQSDASLVVRDDGAVSVGGKIHVWNGGVLTIDADAALGTAPAQSLVDSISLSEGTLAASDSFALDARRGVTLLSPGGIIDVAAGQELTLEGLLSGEGGLTKRGDGDLILTVASYAGPTHIESGNVYFQTGASRSETAGIASSLLENCISLDSIEGNGGMIVGDSVTLCVNSISLDTITIGSPFMNGLSSGKDNSLVGSSAAQSVPEPDTLILLAIAVLFISLVGNRSTFSVHSADGSTRFVSVKNSPTISCDNLRKA